MTKENCALGLDTPAHSHLHRCQGCGSIWGHGNMMEGDVAAHKCPKCGKQEWRVYQGGGRPQGQQRAVVAKRSWHLAVFEYAAPAAMLVALGYFCLCFWREWSNAK